MRATPRAHACAAAPDPPISPLRSLAWADIHPRLPWLVDAFLCMAMDAVIMGQFVAYHRQRRQGKAGSGAEHGGGGRGRSGAAGSLQEPLLGAGAV